MINFPVELFLPSRGLIKVGSNRKHNTRGSKETEKPFRSSWQIPTQQSPSRIPTLEDWPPILAGWRVRAVSKCYSASRFLAPVRDKIQIINSLQAASQVPTDLPTARMYLLLQENSTTRPKEIGQGKEHHSLEEEQPREARAGLCSISPAHPTLSSEETKPAVPTLHKDPHWVNPN